MNNLLVRALLPFFLLSGLALAVPGDLDCLKVGKTPFTANPNLESDGMPVGAKQVGKTQWYDKDFASTEAMGSGDTILIENKGGNISGPNGGCG